MSALKIYKGINSK